jgi:hypothetical protein
MNNETKENDIRTEFVADSPTKQAWHAPEIEEVDFAETQSGTNTGDDGFGTLS